MAIKIFASDFQTSAYTLILFAITFMENNCLLIRLVGRSLLLPMTVLSYLGTPTLPVFNLIQVVLSGGFVSDPDGLLKFDSHGFIQSTNALSSGETNGYQHLLFFYCPSEVIKCSKFFKAPNLISHTLFYSLHGEKVFDDLPVTATSVPMAKLINRKMDAVLPGSFEMQKNSSEVTYWKNGTMGSTV